MCSTRSLSDVFHHMLYLKQPHPNAADRRRRKRHFGSKIVQESKKIFRTKLWIEPLNGSEIAGGCCDNRKEPSLLRERESYKKNLQQERSPKNATRSLHTATTDIIYLATTSSTTTYPNIPSSVPSSSSHNSPYLHCPQLLDSFTLQPSTTHPPRVPTGTHQSFHKEIMAELIRHALPTKI